jgi:hypothetical protein
MIPCCLKLTPNPAGGISIYNMVPVDDEEPVAINKAVLETRYNLDEIFHEVSEGEIIDRLIYYFGDVPKLLRRAFASRVPNIEKVLSKATAVYSTKVSEEEDDDVVSEESFVSAPKTKSAPRDTALEEDRSFAPREDDLPDPTPQASLSDDDEEEKEVTIPKRKKVSDSGKKLSMKDLMD